MWQFLTFYQFASDACWGTSTAWWHYDTDTGVTTATHCTSTCIHNETHQKPTQHGHKPHKQGDKMLISRHNWVTDNGKVTKLTLEIRQGHEQWHKLDHKTQTNICVKKEHSITTTTTTILRPPDFLRNFPRWDSTKKVKPIWIYWSKRQWVAVASAGPYANLQLAPDNHASILTFNFYRPDALPAPNQQHQSTESDLLNSLKHL